MVYKIQRGRSGGVLHGARPGWLIRWPHFKIFSGQENSYIHVT
jgi:hypothetical protein